MKTELNTDSLNPFIKNLNVQDFKSEHFRLKELTEGVYAAIHKVGGYAVGNAGIVNLGDETLVFDTFISPLAASDLKMAAERLTGNPVTYVVNSHYHNDHIRGNQVFSGARIIATQKTKKLIEKNEPENLVLEKSIVDQRIEAILKNISEETNTKLLEEHKFWLGYFSAIKESFHEYKITVPNYIVNETLNINRKARNVVLFSNGKGHTESDLVMWLPKEKILFAGDLLFVESHPVLGDGFVSEWINYLEKIKELNPEKIVPGHGNIGNINHIDQMISYIQTVSKTVNDAITGNLSEKELQETDIPSQFNDWWLGRFFSINLTVLYNQKTGNPLKK